MSAAHGKMVRMVRDSVSTALAQQTLQQGAAIVAALVERLPAGAVREQALAVQAVAGELMWTEVRAGGLYAMPGPAQTRSDVVVVLVSDDQAYRFAEVESFQTRCQPDGTVHVIVRAKRLTPLWAGLVLFHELVHAHDFRSGAEPCDPSPDEWLAGELRAYRLEAALLDVSSDGRLTEALRDFLSRDPADQPSAADLAGDRGPVLAQALGQAALGDARTAPASAVEEGLRGAALVMAALLAKRFDQPDPVAIEHPEEALSALRQFAKAYRGGQERTR